jgi:hypothetical protein
MSAGIKDDGNILGAQGIVAHYILEKVIANGMSVEDFSGEAKAGKHAVTITDEMRAAVSDTVSWFYSLREPGDKVYVERAITPDVQKLDPDLGGTADILVLRPKAGLIWVVDYKHGDGVYVPVQDNAQLMYYALGALLWAGEGFTRVRVSIAQPRIESEEGRFRSWDFAAFDLMDFATKLTHAASLTRMSDAPIAAGDWCRWCKARAICPELEKKQNTLVTFSVPPAQIGDQLQYDPESLARLLESIPLVEQRIKAIREFAHQEAARGISIPRHKLVQKLGNRKWVDPKEAATELIRIMADTGAPQPVVDLYTTPELKSVNQVEKILGIKTLADIVKESPVDLIVREKSGTALVPDTDTRPAITGGVEFDVLEGGVKNDGS